MILLDIYPHIAWLMGIAASLIIIFSLIKGFEERREKIYKPVTDLKKSVEENKNTQNEISRQKIQLIDLLRNELRELQIKVSTNADSINHLWEELHKVRDSISNIKEWIRGAEEIKAYRIIQLKEIKDDIKGLEIFCNDINKQLSKLSP